MTEDGKIVDESLVPLAVRTCLREQWAVKCIVERAAPAILIALKNGVRRGEAEMVLCSPEGVENERVVWILEQALRLVKAGNVR